MLSSLVSYSSSSLPIVLSSLSSSSYHQNHLFLLPSSTITTSLTLLTLLVVLLDARGSSRSSFASAQRPQITKPTSLKAQHKIAPPATSLTNKIGSRAQSATRKRNRNSTSTYINDNFDVSKSEIFFGPRRTYLLLLLPARCFTQTTATSTGKSY